MEKINICHSLIKDYPPDINKFPKFYNCKEFLFVLEPGDMLYIPPLWFHWVHSYQDQNENIAVSFPIVEFKEQVYNKFSENRPFIYSLDKDKYPFLSIKKSDIDKTNQHKALISKSNKCVPVIKNEEVKWENITITEAEKIKETGKFVSFGQSCSLAKELKITPPSFILSSFPKSKFTSCTWVYLFPKDQYIDSGLHYDNNPGVLIQIKGKKIVRMYAPYDDKNLYVSPFKMQI